MCVTLESIVGKKIDLTGQRFGRLVVLEDSGERLGVRKVIGWKCVCDCGNEKIINGFSLKTGSTKSCGCLNIELIRKDISNERFGRLVAINPTDERKDGSVIWECLCDCGNFKNVKVKNLTQGDVKSCGCLFKEIRQSEIYGERFGRLVAIKPTDERACTGNIKWLCKCDCGNEKIIAAGSLIQGGSNSCGCLQKETASKNGTRLSIDITGERFGRLIAIKPTEERKGTNIKWIFKCDCGNEKVISISNVRTAITKSCGCLRKELIKLSNSKRNENTTSH
jgi:hypothetical protein